VRRIRSSRLPLRWGLFWALLVGLVFVPACRQAPSKETVRYEREQPQSPESNLHRQASLREPWENNHVTGIKNLGQRLQAEDASLKAEIRSAYEVVHGKKKRNF